jgi:hypothetical protein
MFRRISIKDMSQRPRGGGGIGKDYLRDEAIRHRHARDHGCRSALNSLIDEIAPIGIFPAAGDEQIAALDETRVFANPVDFHIARVGVIQLGIKLTEKLPQKHRDILFPMTWIDQRATLPAQMNLAFAIIARNAARAH